MFKTFLEISLAMSIVILFIIVISKFLDNKYKIKWRYFIWLLITVVIKKQWKEEECK